MTNFLRGCRLLWLTVTTEWLIAATTALAGESIWNHNGPRRLVIIDHGTPYAIEGDE